MADRSGGSDNRRRLELPGRPRPYLLAHRGDRVRWPENSLPAFQKAWEAGADLVETDLRLTRDGEIVCLHDPSVDRTTDGRGLVAGMTLAEVRRWRLRPPASPGGSGISEVGIPTLEEVAVALPPDRGLALELKGAAFRRPEVARRVVATVERAGIRGRTVMLSFSRASLATFREVAPDLPLGLITMWGLTPPSGFELVGPAWPILFINPFYVRQAHRRGQLVCPLDPAPDRRLWWYRGLGCDAVLTDDPVATAIALGRQP